MALSIQKPLTNEYALAYDADPAFDRTLGGKLEPAPPGASEEEVAKVTASNEEAFAKAYATCNQTLDYTSILLPGATPTLFVFRPIRAMESSELRAAARDDVEMAVLAFRLALVRIENPEIRVEREVDKDAPRLGAILKRHVTDMLGDVSKQVGRVALDLPLRLGTTAYYRSILPSPP